MKRYKHLLIILFSCSAIHAQEFSSIDASSEVFIGFNEAKFHTQNVLYDESSMLAWANPLHSYMARTKTDAQSACKKLCFDNLSWRLATTLELATLFVEYTIDTSTQQNRMLLDTNPTLFLANDELFFNRTAVLFFDFSKNSTIIDESINKPVSYRCVASLK